jgi:adenylylsulfate kinase
LKNINKELKNKILSKPLTILLTGLSGAGKSTIAEALSAKLSELGIKNTVLDGDNIRQGLNKDLSFSDSDKSENIRRVAEVAKLMNSTGLTVITAFISPFKKDRRLAREVIGRDRFIEIYVNTDIEVCRRRDPKGLYKQAENGEISNFTGIDSPYESPEKPDIKIDTRNCREKDSISKIIQYLYENSLINCS